MDVSVVVPTRNRRSLLELTLRSVLRQRDVDLEVIVVDEGSTDDTPAVLAAVADSRLRVIRNDRPRGVSAARNRGAASSRADWVAFLDDDDLWAPDKLTRQLETVRQTGAAWVYVGHVNININHQVTGGEPPLSPDELLRQLPQHNVVPGGCSGVMVSKQQLVRAGRFDEELQPLADWDLWLRLASLGAPACVPEPLVAYRVHGRQMSLDAGRIQAEFPVILSRNREADSAVLYRYLAWWALRVKDYRSASKFFIRAWLERRPAFPDRVLAADLAALATDILEYRLRLRLPRRSQPTDAGEPRAWRARGQAWVNALINQEVTPTDSG